MIQIEEVVRKLLAEAAKDNNSAENIEVKPDNKLIDDLNLDSLSIVQLVTEIEDAFDIEIPDDFAEKITTAGDLYRFVEMQMSASHT